MQGISRASLAQGQEQLDALLAGAGQAAVTALAEDLFGVTELLAATPALRRALTDPARPAHAKRALVERLLGQRIGVDVLGLVADLACARWADAGDLTDTVEVLAVNAVLAQAEASGRLDAVEDELFRFARTVAGDVGLRDAFAVRTPGGGRKAELVHRLLDRQAAPETVRLAVQAAVAPRGQRTEAVLERYVQAAAHRRQQLIAQVVSAVPLDAGQRERLAATLSRQYGRQVRVAVEVDPRVLGGLRVQVGGLVVDGTVSTRLESARLHLGR